MQAGHRLVLHYQCLFLGQCLLITGYKPLIKGLVDLCSVLCSMSSQTLEVVDWCQPSAEGSLNTFNLHINDKITQQADRSPASLIVLSADSS